MTWVIALSIIIVVGLIVIIILSRRLATPPHKAAGDAGEDAAASVIKRVLHKGDKCFRNVPVLYDGLETELDFLIVNSSGVFIIEVKNYSGEIRGRDDDKYWEKTKTSQGGNAYVKRIENPIPQIKREEYLLGKFLRSEGIRVWVKGYVFFIRCNRPFRNRYLLNSGNEIDREIHQQTDRELSGETIKRIIEGLDL